MKTWITPRRVVDLLLSGFGLGVVGDLDFTDAPGGDLSLDDIFGETSASTTVEPTPTPTPVQATTPEEPFIKVKTGTVYKTKDDAVQGIERKDALILELRQKLEQQTGVDPLTRRQPQAPKSYLEDQEQYFEDIAKAVSDKNTKAYMEAQQKLILDTLGPIGPTITSLSRAHAESVVAQQLPEFKGFLGSEEFRQVSEDAPLLADAIRSAENNPAAAGQLPELYKVAYLASQGRRVPELLQSAVRAVPVQPRPTMHSSPTPAPATTGQPVTAPSLDTKEGRKALIEQMEGKGVGNLKW